MAQKNRIKKLKKFSSRVTSVKPHLKYWYGWYYEHAKVKKGTILLESFHGKTINDSPLVCALEIERLYPGQYKMYYATTSIKDNKDVVSDLGLNVELVEIDTNKYVNILATAEYIISNASLPIYYIRKDGQKYLQTWHGTPLKTLGKKMREGIESMYNVQHNFLQASHIMFPNDFTRKAIMEDYNLENLYTGKVVMCGYPRNKVFFDKEAGEAVRRRYGLEDKTVYAYMPTWRGTSNRDISNMDYFLEVRDIFTRLDEVMRDDQVMYVNFHPIIKGEFSFEGFEHIKPFPEDVSNYDFLNCSDALITDYSSVFFDYSLTGKPVIMFMYDYEKYLKDRGLYMDLSTLPFRQIYDVAEFCKCIATDGCLEDSYSDTDYAKEFLGYDSADCTAKLLDLFLNDAEGLEVDDYSANLDKELKAYKPVRVNARSDLKTLSRVVDRDDSVVLMYRNWFNNGVGQMLYDDYNEFFDYIITTNTPPRTYLTQLLSKLGSESAKKHIWNNDKKRIFGDVNIGTDYLEEFGVIEEGYRVDRSRIIRTDAEFKPTDRGSLLIKPEAVSGMEFTEAILLDENFALVERRDLTKEEASGDFIDYDFHNVIENYLVYDRETCVPGIIAKDEDGKEHVVCYTDSSREYLLDKPISNSKKHCSYVPATGTFTLPTDYERAKFKTILNSPDEYVRETIHSFNNTPKDIRLAFIPGLYHIKLYNIIKVRVCVDSRAIDYISNAASLRSYRFDNTGFRITSYLPGWKKEEITGGMLILDSAVEEKTIPLKAVVRETSGGCIVTVSLSFDQHVDFSPLRWHCRITVRVGDEEHYLKIKCYSYRLEQSLKIMNVQSEVSEGWIVYPYIGKADILKLCYREKTKYDTNAIRAKEFTALVFYNLMKLNLKRHDYYLIYEKFSSTAQDNAYFFFKYCMEELPEKERKKFLYVIDKKSQDYQYVEKYEPQVIDFMSIKHMVLAMVSDLVISTDSIQHFYAWRTKPSLVFKKIQKNKVFFLQHGVTAMKRVDNLFGKKGSSPMKYFVTTSSIEQSIVVKDFGYNVQDAPIVGFTRWDALVDKTDPDDRFILIMPTWRAWLEDLDEESFRESTYFKEYTRLIESDGLAKILKDNDLRVVLYLHPKLASYISNFQAQPVDRIEMVAFGQEPLNELMMRCSLLITDYSSVCWDVLFMDKPVIFYHFDLDKYMAAHGSYIDLTKDLPSPRVTNQDDLLDEIRTCVSNDFVIEPDYQDQLGRFFAYRDNHNCERTYQFLKQVSEN